MHCAPVRKDFKMTYTLYCCGMRQNEYLLIVAENDEEAKFNARQYMKENNYHDGHLTRHCNGEATLVEAY